MNKKENEKISKKNKRNYKSKVIIVILLSVFLFFILPFFHNWANSLKISLHFCDHVFCVIYSLIWLVFLLISSYKLHNKNEKNSIKKWLIIYLLVLVVGIILMNIIPCDDTGKVDLDFDKIGFFNKDGIGINKENSLSDLKKKNETNGNESFTGDTFTEDIIDTDGGLVYDVRGIIYTGDNHTKEDFCLDSDVLKEYYIQEIEGGISILFTEINCRMNYDSSSCCKEGKCILNCYEEMSCEEIGESYSDRENYGWVFMKEDEECEDLSKGGCEYGVEWYNEVLEDCCIWKCREKTISCTDNDGDNYAIEGRDCGIVDCDDSNSNINPGEIEDCKDGIDNDCDGYIDCDDSNCDCMICQDSDSGKNLETPGICNNGTDYKDYCFDKTNLMESWCKGDVCKVERFQCENMCIEISEGGKCI